jgi:hypothetical protein
MRHCLGGEQVAASKVTSVKKNNDWDEAKQHSEEDDLVDWIFRRQ